MIASVKKGSGTGNGPRAIGPTSRKAYEWAVSASLREGISPLMILQKMQLAERDDDDIWPARVAGRGREGQREAVCQLTLRS